ncbi:MAG: hypothetical protein H7Z21_09770 [Hymenobacter sp.]|nr:hypothetical protein [Hymenobacter sp.]
MKAEEEFLKNAASMVRFAEEEIKQFLAWTGKRSPYSRSAEEIRTKLQTAAADLKCLQKEYGRTPVNGPFVLTHAAIPRNGTPALD